MLIIVELIRRSILVILLGEAVHGATQGCTGSRVLQVETYHAHAIFIHATPSITYYQLVTLGNYDVMYFSVVSYLYVYVLGLERIHQVTNTIRIAIQGGEYDTYREYTFSQRLN